MLSVCVGERAQVAEWLKAADCKSAALCATKVRILPCAPLFVGVGNMSKPVDDFKLNPAASKQRMWLSLAVLAGLALVAWLTIDADAVVNVKQISTWFFSTGYFTIHLRWVPLLFLALFALRIWLAHMRATMENRPDKEG
jgi:hypothetical protein